MFAMEVEGLEKRRKKKQETFFISLENLCLTSVMQLLAGVVFSILNLTSLLGASFSVSLLD